MMKLYHGSNIKIAEVDLSQCNPYKDFGQAFYLTIDKDQAMDVAHARVDIFGGVPPHMHSFDVVYGPIANDRVGLQIRNYRLGNIDKKEFLRRLKYMKGITFQYAFCTKRAIEKLQPYECK